MLTYESVIYTNLTSKFFVDQVISAYDGKGPGGSAPRLYCEDQKRNYFLAKVIEVLMYVFY